MEEAEKVFEAGLGNRMMLEISPERTFGVLAPAFYGCEGGFALNAFSGTGCNFLKNNLCELFGTGMQPLECRYCHHDRKGMGIVCHSDIEKDWRSDRGQELVSHWMKIRGRR